MAFIIRLDEVDDSFAHRWAELFDRALEPYPYLDVRALRPGAAQHRAAAPSRFIAVEEGGALIGLMPIATERPFRKLPIRALTNRSPFLDLESVWHHPLLDTSRSAVALEALLEGAMRLGMPSLIDLVVMPGDGIVADTLQSVVAERGWAQVLRDEHMGVLTRRESVGEVEPLDGDCEPDLSLPYVSGRARRLYARTVRELESISGPVRASEESSDPAAIQAFLDLQMRGWKGDEARGGNAYRRAGLEGWFTAYTDALRAAGRLRVTVLRAGRRIVHIGIQVRVGDRVFGLADAFEEQYAHLGPGAVGRIVAMKSALAEEGVAHFDPNMSAQYSSTHSARIYPDRRPRMRWLIGAGRSSRMFVRAQPMLRGLRDRFQRSTEESATRAH